MKQYYREQFQGMPKTIVIAISQDYPFLMSKSNLSVNNNSVLVRKKIKTNQSNSSLLISKATFVKNLRNKHLVKVEKIVSQEGSLSIYYQSIQSQYDWQDPGIINQVYNQIRNFTTYLSNIGIKAALKPNKIGITDKKVLKYYLGIDFSWDQQKDDEHLIHFYHSELNKLFGNNFSSTNNTSNQVIQNFTNHQTNDKIIKQGLERKISFALTSRKDRISNIQKQMNKKRLNRFTPAPLLRDKLKLVKKWEDRKFSSDYKNNLFSTKRLEKQSDVRSERGAETATNRLRSYYERQNNQEQIETVNSKSRVEQIKYQQYVNIVNSPKEYLQQFIQVLDENTHTSKNLSPHKSNSTRHIETSLKNDDNVNISAEILKMKTQQAIIKSKKIINRVKGLPLNSIIPY